MFGYVKPNKNKLTVENNSIYKSYYCSLCNGLSTNLGFTSRFMVNYDITFALICLDCLVEDKKTHEGRCPFNPLKNFCLKLNDNTLSFASFINYYLFCEKLHDHTIDDSRKFVSFIYKLALKILGHNKRYKHHCSFHKDLVAKLDSIMAEIYALEINCNNHSADDYFNLFGSYTQHIYDYFIAYYNINLSSQQSSNISGLFYNLGKWIYLMDAFDDYYDDIKRGRFNPLCISKPSPDSLYSKENIMILCDHVSLMNQLLISKIMHYLNLIEHFNENEIIKNILSLGCSNVFYSIMHTRHLSLINKEDE